MRHSIDWLDDALNEAPEERATVGGLRLFVNEKNVTHHLVEGRVSDHITVALYGLVHGLTHDWWSIFGARDCEFSLRQYRTGYLLPDIRFHFDGAAFEISAHECAYDNPDLRFWGGAREVMSRREGEDWLSRLIDDVLARLAAMNVKDTSAAMRWRRVQSSSKSIDERSFCEAAGSLRMDPYQISESAANFIEVSREVFTDDDSLVEFVSGSGNANREKLIAWVQRMMRPETNKYRLADLQSLAVGVKAIAPMKQNERAWELGYRRARAMRQQRDLQHNHRFSSFVDLARTFGAGVSYEPAPVVNGINALRREQPNGTHIHLRNHGDSEEASVLHLFAMARSVGDAVCFPNVEVAPINGLQQAYRQAAGRAFAAEFLAPIDEILSMQRDGRDVVAIANEFRVSSAVIDHQIENKDRIAAACQ